MKSKKYVFWWISIKLRIKLEYLDRNRKSLRPEIELKISPAVPSSMTLLLNDTSIEWQENTFEATNFINSYRILLNVEPFCSTFQRLSNGIKILEIQYVVMKLEAPKVFPCHSLEVSFDEILISWMKTIYAFCIYPL